MSRYEQDILNEVRRDVLISTGNTIDELIIDGARELAIDNLISVNRSRTEAAAIVDDAIKQARAQAALAKAAGKDTPSPKGGGE